MKVLVGCEFSGRVRDAFIERGHDAVSCDLEETDVPGPHLREDINRAVTRGWDLIILFPPCTYMTVSGNRHYANSPKRKDAIEWTLSLWKTAVAYAKIGVGLENPIGALSTVWRKPDQVIQPWMFGHGECKATCLWLDRLPKLWATHRKDDLFCAPEPEEREQRIWKMAPGPNRARDRSVTYQGIADAMGEQWGKLAAIAEVERGGVA